MANGDGNTAGIISFVKNKYPVESAVAANWLYALYLLLHHDINATTAIGLCLQSLIFALLGAKQRINAEAIGLQNEAISTQNKAIGSQNEAIAQNQAAMAATDTSIPTAVVIEHMAPKTAATTLEIASKLPPAVEEAKERQTGSVTIEGA